jgi:peptidyl-prolyl cis-trans isomerase SurA
VAQQEEPVDRVVAVVGTAAITYTQLQEEYYSRLQAARQQPPSDTAVLHRDMRMILDTLINAELLYQQAIRDTTITVTSIEVNDAVDETMRNMRQQVPSEQVFQAELRRAGFLGIDDYRRWLVDQQMRELLRNRYENKLRGDGTLAQVPPTEREIRAYYEARRATLPPRPPTLSLKQLMIRPGSNPAAKAEARRVADSIASELRAGADFAVAARRFSDDPSSAERGGSLDWFRRGQMVREFERAAFALPVGTISNPVESPFGYHIIQVERIHPTEVKARHILISPTVDSAGIEAARALADSLHLLLEGGANFDSLQAIYHDPSELREGLRMIVDSLGPDYAAALAGVPEGGHSAVFPVSVDGSPPKFTILRVTERVPAGPVPYEQVRDQIRTLLGRSLGEQRYFTELRRKTHIEVRAL